MKFLLIGLALLMALMTPDTAQASRFNEAPPFASQPVNASALSEVRGGQSPFAALTVATANRMVDDNARADLRLTGGVARIEMDWWWGQIGSQLIAENVRAAGAP